MWLLRGNGIPAQEEQSPCVGHHSELKRRSSLYLHQPFQPYNCQEAIERPLKGRSLHELDITTSFKRGLHLVFINPFNRVTIKMQWRGLLRRAVAMHWTSQRASRKVFIISSSTLSAVWLSRGNGRSSQEERSPCIGHHNELQRRSSSTLLAMWQSKSNGRSLKESSCHTLNITATSKEVFKGLMKLQKCPSSSLKPHFFSVFFFKAYHTLSSSPPQIFSSGSHYYFTLQFLYFEYL